MLRPCPTCQRHVSTVAMSCVFCGAAVPPPIARDPIIAVGRVSRAMVFAGAIAAAPLGCGSQLHYEALPAQGSAAASTGEVRGRVMKHDGKPAAHSSITLYGETLRAVTAGMDSITVQVDANGSFVFPNVPPGEYRLNANAVADPPTFTVRAGQAAVLSLELEKPPRQERHMAKPYGAPPARRRLV